MGDVIPFPRPYRRRPWTPADITREQCVLVWQWMQKERRLKAERAAKRAAKRRRG